MTKYCYNIDYLNGWLYGCVQAACGNPKLVGDLVYSDDFDCNCNYDIYDCTEDGKQYGDGAELIFGTKRDGFGKPLDRVLDMKIKYITTQGSTIVIEATK